MSIAHEDFIVEVNAIKAFQYLTLIASLTSPSNTQLGRYQQFSPTSCPQAQVYYLIPGALHEQQPCQKDLYGGLSKTASDFVQSGVP